MGNEPYWPQEATITVAEHQKLIADIEASFETRLIGMRKLHHELTFLCKETRRRLDMLEKLINDTNE